MKRRVLVVGSSRGIGRAIAMRLSENGFQVSVHGRSPSDALEESYRALCVRDAETRMLCFDVRDREATRSVLEAELQEFGAYYGVVLSSGIHRDAAFPAMEPDAWDDVLRVDLDGFYNVLHPLVLPMIQLRAGGRIVPIASLSGITGNRGQVNYSAAKAGIIGASKALARELAKRRITVNCVAPGAIETEMLQGAPAAELLKQIPMNRFGQVEEVAAAVSYLFSPEAEYMTGQTLVLSGGLF